MTEADLWQSLKPRFIAAGGLPVRIENVANLSLPDVALIGVDKTVWIELKIARGHRVLIPRYQYAFAHMLANKVDLGLFWMVVAKDDEVRCYYYQDIVTAAAEGNGASVVVRLEGIRWVPVPEMLGWVK